jgi:hypothetical protein
VIVGVGVSVGVGVTVGVCVGVGVREGVGVSVAVGVCVAVGVGVSVAVGVGDAKRARTASAAEQPPSNAGARIVLMTMIRAARLEVTRLGSILMHAFPHAGSRDCREASPISQGDIGPGAHRP